MLNSFCTAMYWQYLFLKNSTGEAKQLFSFCKESLNCDYPKEYSLSAFFDLLNIGIFDFIELLIEKRETSPKTILYDPIEC